MKELFGVLLSLALVLSFSLLTASPVQAATHEVGPEKTHATIQAAVNAAGDGDTILVYPGTYTENVDLFDKYLTIRGVGGSGYPTLEGTLYINQAGISDPGPTTIEYMNFLAVDHDNPYGGYGVNSILIVNADSIIIKHCNFDGAGRFMETPYSRSAIMMRGGSVVTVDSCVIQNGYYMAIYPWTGATNELTLTNSTIDNCKSGINFAAGSSLLVENSYIRVVAQAPGSNTYGIRITVPAGGSFIVEDSTVIMDDNGVTPDQTPRHEAIWVRGSGDGADMGIKDSAIIGGLHNLTTASPRTEVDARDNWWGDASGPYHATNPGGAGGPVSDDVLFNPWYFLEDLRIPITSYDDIDDTASGTGPARFGASEGAIANLRTVDEADLPVLGKPYFVFPHGFFALDIVGVTVGGEVTVSIILPQPAPPGTQYWKYYDDTWHRIPMTIDPIDSRIIHITLVDGGLGDASGVPDGTIEDQGGPGNPVTVGWEGSLVNRMAVAAPWLILLATMVVGVTVLVVRRRRAQT